MIVVEDIAPALKDPEEARGLLGALARPLIMTAGVFDGLHLAHRHLVRRVIDKARAARGSAGVFTFSNHPLSVLAPPYAPKLLLTAERKRELFEEMGVDLLVMPRFSTDFSALPPETFLRDLMGAWLGIDRLIVGFDFRFGQAGAGDADFLRERASEFGFKSETLAAIHHDGRPVSSTLVRELIDAGRVRQAGEMLGRPYELSGRVVGGYGRGTQLGFPTANLEFDPARAIPPSGVYATRVRRDDQTYMGMMNIGSSPTFSGARYRPEVHLLDLEPQDLYGQVLRVEFIDRLREERKFESVSALRQRLRVDETLTRAILESSPNENE